MLSDSLTFFYLFSQLSLILHFASDNSTLRSLSFDPHKTQKMMAVVGYHTAVFINENYFEYLRCKKSFQCNVPKGFYLIFTLFSLVLMQSPTTVSWMDNTKLLGISTATVKI